MGKRTSDPSKLPKIFYVNWFRKNAAGKFVWPGFGENSRVLDWIFRRCDNESPSAKEGEAVETPIGFIPDYENGALDLDGLDLSEETMKDLFKVDTRTWQGEVDRQEAYQAQFGSRLPRGIVEQREKLRERL